MVPLLVLVARQSQHEAHATSLAAVVLMGAVGAATFAADGQVDVGLALALAAGSLIGAPLGAKIMARTAEGQLKIAFGVLMLVVAGLMLAPTTSGGSDPMELTLPIVLAIALFGIGVGLLSALFGIGGGIAMVPFMVLLLERSQHLAEGTSLLVIIPTAIAGVLAHHKRGYVSFRLAATLAIGGVVGAFLGARLALTLDASALEMYFAIFLVLMGVRIILEGVKMIREKDQAIGAPD